VPHPGHYLIIRAFYKGKSLVDEKIIRYGKSLSPMRAGTVVRRWILLYHNTAHGVMKAISGAREAAA
jgi:hypothetical protein